MKILKNNGLSIVFFILFVIALIGQIASGLKEHNSEMAEEGGQSLTLRSIYLPAIFYNPLLKTGKVNFCRWRYLLF
jgi:hypothetical protein